MVIPSLSRGTPLFKFLTQYIYLFLSILATTSVVDIPLVLYVALNFPSLLRRAQASSIPAVTYGMSSCYKTDIMFGSKFYIKGQITLNENPRGFWHGLINISILSHHLNPLLFRTNGQPYITYCIPLCNSTSSQAQTPAISHIF